MINLSMEQENAVELCSDLHVPIVGVTGGAGVGKTLVLGKAYKEVYRRAPTVLCAPTGRAAKRIAELTGIKAVTIHKLLEYPTPDTDFTLDGPEANPHGPRRSGAFPLEQKCVFVDESSMLSPTLYNQLLDALPTGGTLRFFGDNNQLPPVEKGRPPFKDVLENYPSVELTYNYRSDDHIVSNAQRILEGRLPIQNERFRILYTDDPVSYLLKFVEKERNFMDDSHQVIIPARKGGAGTGVVNPRLQLRFNRGGAGLKLDRYDAKEPLLTVRAGDKYLWIKNDYTLNMYNGDIGRIESLSPDDGTLKLTTGFGHVLVPPRVRAFNQFIGYNVNYDPRKQIELGYAVTTHKAQGSEFDYVIYVMCRGHAWLLNRQNLYTAVTRARRMVIIITDRASMGWAMRWAKTEK